MKMTRILMAMLAFTLPGWSEETVTAKLSLASSYMRGLQTLGPVHVAGPGPHRIPLVVHGAPETQIQLKGELFRLQTTTAIPVAEFVWLEPGAIPKPGELRIEPLVTLPDLDAPIRYLAKFADSKFPSVTIQYHPADFLDPLREFTRGQPLLLVHPLQALPETLRGAGLSVEVSRSVPARLPEHAVMVLFSTPATPPAVPMDGRLLVCDAEVPGREVWKRPSGQGWTIHVHPDDLAPEILTTTAGLVRLVDLIMNTP